MEEVIFVGKGAELEPRSAADWLRDLEAALPRIRARLDFMSPDHHRIRNLVVLRLAEGAGPISPPWIAARLGIELARVERCLDELERGLFFLVRNQGGEVSWAFPVTADPTPHRVDLGGDKPIWGA